MKKAKTSIETPRAVVSWPVMTQTEWRVLGVILVIGAILRLLFLGRCNLWQDEMGFISLANPQSGLGALARQSWEWILSIGQQPLGFMLQNLYMKLVSGFVPDIMYNPFWARLHWLLWGVAAIGGLYAMVRTASSTTTAAVAATLFAVSFYPVFYAREVYPYAGVMAASAFSAYFAYRHLFYSDRPWKWAAACSFSSLVLVYLHLNGVLFFVMLCLVIGVAWLKGLLSNPASARPHWVQQGTRLILCLVLVGLAVSPYVLRFVFFNKAHTQGSPYPLWMILQDPVAKYFLGERTPALIAAWLALIAGGMRIALRKAPGSATARMLALTGLLAWLFIGFSTARSQYLSARYFAPVAPVFFWIFAEGLMAAGRLIKHTPTARVIPIGLTALYALIHLGFYLPGLYTLRDKDVGFGKIADWLNQNLEPGTPYLMESAYELRWVGGYHPTPNLIGAAPYVHGGAPGELERLHQRQMDFMRRFPEAPFIESAHHNAESPEGIWAWPKQFHARHVQLRNDPLRSLVAKGIFPIEPFQKVLNHSFVTDIYYSTWEDIEAAARASGALVHFRFPGWTVVQIAQGEYRRAAPGNQGRVDIIRLRDEPVRGQLEFSGIGFGPQAGDFSLAIGIEGSEPVRRRQGIGQRWQVAMPLDLSEQNHAQLAFAASSAFPLQGIVLDNLAFKPE